MKNVILTLISLYVGAITIMFGTGSDVYNTKPLYVSQVGLGAISSLALVAMNVINAVAGMPALYASAAVYAICACGYGFLCFKSNRNEWNKTLKIIAIVLGAVTIAGAVLGVILNPDLW